MRATVQSMVCHVKTLSNPTGSMYSQYFGFENMVLFPTRERNRAGSHVLLPLRVWVANNDYLLAGQEWPY